MEANSLVIRGGNVVAEDAILPNHDIVVEDGTIVRIAPTLANARTVDAQLDESTSDMVVDRGNRFPCGGCAWCVCGAGHDRRSFRLHRVGGIAATERCYGPANFAVQG